MLKYILGSESVNMTKLETINTLTADTSVYPITAPLTRCRLHLLTRDGIPWAGKLIWKKLGFWV